MPQEAVEPNARRVVDDSKVNVDQPDHNDFLEGENVAVFGDDGRVVERKEPLGRGVDEYMIPRGGVMDVDEVDEKKGTKIRNKDVDQVAAVPGACMCSVVQPPIASFFYLSVGGRQTP